MSIQHKDIVDPQIHEPKGISSASNGTVYVASGSGSGTWQIVPAASIDTAGLLSIIQDKLNDGSLGVTGTLFLSGVIADISTASSIIIPVINDATVISASFVLGGTITTADAKISVKNSAGAGMGVDVTVPYDGSAKGQQFAFTATGNNVLTGPTWIEIATDGASDTAAPLFVTIALRTIVND